MTTGACNRITGYDLRNKGAIFVEELEEIEDKTRPVIFSAHGVPKAVPEEALSLNLVYYDATCPLVSKIHKEVENFDKKNLPVILIGHRNHPEVIGTMGQLPKGSIKLIETKKDVENLKASNFNQLRKWRLKQEKKLKIQTKNKKNLKIMDKKDVMSFMQTYQRITENMFKNVPKYASIIMNLNSSHQIKSVIYKK